MEVEEVLEDLCKSASKIELVEGDLRVRSSHGRISDELRDAIRANKPAIVRRLLEQAADEAWRQKRIEDPRKEDYPTDSQRWQWVFARVYDDPQEGDELLGALNYIRCEGAAIIKDRSGCRIVPSDCPLEEYEPVKIAVLEPNLEYLRSLLQAMPH